MAEQPPPTRARGPNCPFLSRHCLVVLDRSAARKPEPKYLWFLPHNSPECALHLTEYRVCERVAQGDTPDWRTCPVWRAHCGPELAEG